MEPEEKPFKKVHFDRPMPPNTFQAEANALQDRLKKLDIRIDAIYRQYHALQAREIGTLQPGMVDEMRKTVAIMSQLQIDISLFTQQLGVANSHTANDLNKIVERLVDMIRKFNTALEMHTQNKARNEAGIMADKFLQLYAEVRRAIRDRALKQQFLQEFEGYQDDDRTDNELSDIEEPDSGGRLNNTHSDDAKFRVKKRRKKRSRGHSPNFRAGERSAEGMSQADIEAHTRTEVFGQAATRNDTHIDPDKNMREAIGRSENRDNGNANNNLVVPKAELTGGNSNAKKKGSSREDAIVIGDGAFNVAPPEPRSAATSINLKGAHMKRLRGQTKHVQAAESAKASLGGGRVTRSTAFKKRAPKSKKGKKKPQLQAHETDGTIQDAFTTSPQPGPVVAKPIEQTSKVDPIDAIAKLVVEVAGDNLKRNRHRNEIWSKIKQVWERAKDAYNTSRSGTMTRDGRKKIEARCAEILLQCARDMENFKFSTEEAKNMYATAMWFYGQRYRYARGFSRGGNSNIAFVVGQYQQKGGTQDAWQVGAVWAYFTAAYADIDKLAQMTGAAKIKFSGRPDLYQDLEIAKSEPKPKRQRTPAQRRPGQNTPDHSPEPETPPGRR